MDMHRPNIILRQFSKRTFLARAASSGTGIKFFGVAENKRRAPFIINEVTVPYANPSSRVFERPKSNAVAAPAVAPPRIANAGSLKAALVATVARGDSGRSIMVLVIDLERRGQRGESIAQCLCDGDE